MAEYKKIQNRYYKKEKNDAGVDMIIKATYDAEKDEYTECGRWVAKDFKDIPDDQLDENTKLNKTQIKSDLKITK